MSKKDAVKQIEQDAQDMFDQEKRLHALEVKLSENEEFKQFMALQNKLKTQEELFRETVKNEMLKYDIPKIKGEWGSITLVEKSLIKVTDESKVPDEFKVLKVDNKLVKEEYELTDVLPSGVEIAKSQYVLIKGAK